MKPKLTLKIDCQTANHKLSLLYFYYIFIIVTGNTFQIFQILLTKYKHTQPTQAYQSLLFLTSNIYIY